MMNEIEELLRGVAKELTMQTPSSTISSQERFYWALGESGLLRLLEAGQAMREAIDSDHDAKYQDHIDGDMSCVSWDSKSARVPMENNYFDTDKYTCKSGGDLKVVFTCTETEISEAEKSLKQEQP